MSPKPKIGITCEREMRPPRRPVATLREDYAEAVAAFGGIPFLLPALGPESDVSATLEALDGIIISGGAFDIHPRFFGEKPHPRLDTVDHVRTRFELGLASESLRVKTPILGICGGCQALNVVAGGTLYQDIDSQLPGSLKHRAPRSVRHGISIARGSMLVKWFRGLSGRVNTSHHQAVKDPAPSFNVTAKANDGVIEAIEAKDHPFAVGVQWHPEILYRKDAPAAALFKALIQAANQFSKRRRER